MLTTTTMNEILVLNQKGCIAMAPDGKLNLCFGQLHFEFTETEMDSFTKFLSHVKNEMEVVFGYNHVFFETGLSQMRVGLSKQEIHEMLDLFEDADIALSVKELIHS